MRPRRFNILHTEYSSLNRVQQDIEPLLNTLLDHPIARGRVIETTLASGVNAIPHGLGRVPQGFFAMAVVRGATGGIADDSAANPHTDRLLYVHASTACTAHLLVY